MVPSPWTTADTSFPSDTGATSDVYSSSYQSP